MPYVKISDPQVIDLAAWHQVINVVNQHSDSISSITNNLGGAIPEVVDFNGENNFVNQYDPGSQKILYGRYQITPEGISEIYNGQIWHGTINFAENGQTAFDGGRPIVTGTIMFGHNSIEDLDNKHYDFIFNIFHVTTEGFSFRVNRAIAEPNNNVGSKPTTINATFYLNWSATGPA